ncbi:Photosystem II PsbP [Macleaya cordata]|uniref:Photosystem II PsbP n=1 Tax=Macleaya cordata TaxID=56857 RepID=A0A200R6G0_MACCD|nr:Photosystem II PsbP [Macleaya cordata]
MASLQNSPSIHRTLFLNASSQVGLQKPGVVTCSRRGVAFLVRAEQTMSPRQDRPGRRQALVVGTIGAWVSLINPTSASFAAEAKKGFLGVLDKKDGYEFLYPFGWQEVSIEGLDKVVKDVIEPLESASVTMIPTSKQDIRDLGSPQQVAEVLIKKVWASPSEKTKLVEATEHEVDGKAYYTIEFIGQTPNYTRHALAAICIGNGKFYTFTTGANQRRWEKMKDKLHTVVDSFKIFNV